jgi:uncharacterized Zn finger protein (UPF0148 family)
MDIIKTNCPECASPLEFPKDFDSVICAKCGTAFQVRAYKDAINLSPRDQTVWPSTPTDINEAEALAVVESRLAELDELISEAGAEVETLKSRELSVPLQTGCSFFGLFMLVIIVITAFMPLGRKYFGNWLFYLAIALVILLGLQRIRRKQASPAQIEQLRAERLNIEAGLAQLEAERDHVRDLKAKITSFDLKESDH